MAPAGASKGLTSRHIQGTMLAIQTTFQPSLWGSIVLTSAEPPCCSKGQESQTRIFVILRYISKDSGMWRVYVMCIERIR